MPAIVERFGARAPDAELVIVPGTSRQLHDAVVADEIYLAFTVEPPFALPKSLVAAPVAEQPFTLVVPAGEPDADPLELLRERPLLVYARDSWGGRTAWSWIVDRCDAPRVRCELDALETVATLVARGLGVAVLPRWDGLAERADVRLLALPDDAAGATPSRRVVALGRTVTERAALARLCVPDVR